jgi:hypothetical protein
MDPTTPDPETPGVQPAEDADLRNKIIIAVTVSVVALSVLSAGLILYFKRKSRIQMDNASAFASIFPPIQPDMVSSMRNGSPIPEKAGTAAGVIKSSDPISNFKPLSAEEIQEQEKLKAKFRKRQETFKEERGKLRSGNRDLPKVQPEEDISEDLAEEQILPSSHSEEEVLRILETNLNADMGTRQSLYKDLMFQWHPDKHPSDTGRATGVFQFLQSRKKWFLRVSSPKSA